MLSEFFSIIQTVLTGDKLFDEILTTLVESLFISSEIDFSSSFCKFNENNFLEFEISKLFDDSVSMVKFLDSSKREFKRFVFVFVNIVSFSSSSEGSSSSWRFAFNSV